MISPTPRSCSGVRSPRRILASTVTNPSWRWGTTLDSRKWSNSRRSPLGEAYCTPGSGARASSSTSKVISVRGKAALGDPVALEFLLDQVAEGVDADLVDEHLDA